MAVKIASRFDRRKLSRPTAFQLQSTGLNRRRCFPGIAITAMTTAHIAVLVAMISIASACGATWEESFEGKFSKSYFAEPEVTGVGWSNTRINPATGYSGTAGSVSLVKTPTRKGSGAMKCVRSEKGKRMELELVNRDEKDSPRMNQHSWAGISILVPETGAANKGMCIQWHGGMPGAAQGKEYAQGPECCLRFDDEKFIYWSNSKESKSAEPVRKTATLVEKVKPGEWYDFVFHQFFSLNEDGLTEIWVNGKKAYTQNGCNAFYYRTKYAFKFGMYGTGSPGAIYFDQAKVMTGTGSYEQVAPGGAKPAVIPASKP